jgi:hypothetical protein
MHTNNDVKRRTQCYFADLWMGNCLMFLGISMAAIYFVVAGALTLSREGWARFTLASFKETERALSLCITLAVAKLICLPGILVALIPTVPSR